jgi:hypothetical protein
LSAPNQSVIPNTGHEASGAEERTRSAEIVTF